MNDFQTSDAELLAAWVRQRDEAAFGAVVNRYRHLVYMAARRTCGSDTMAADASQLVFILLARKAGALVEHPSLGGWLHVAAVRTTRDLIDKAAREARKIRRMEQEQTAHVPATDDAWGELRPVLDEVLAALPEKDREAILLRFFRALSVREVAGVLGIATAAAQKRIERATERLRDRLLRRGCRFAGSLGGVLLAGFASDAQAAVPAASLLAGKGIAAAQAGAGVVSSSTAAFTSAMTKGSSALLPAALLVTGGIWLFMQFQAIGKLEQGNAILAAGLAAEPPAPVTMASAKPVTTALDEEPVDWFEVARQLRASNASGPVNASGRLEERFAAMELEEVERAFEEVAMAGLNPGDLDLLEKRLCQELGGAKGGPWLVMDRFVAVINQGSWKWTLGQYFKNWMDMDPDEAIAWLARHVDGIPTLQWEFLDVSLHPLLATSPVTAGRLLGAIPPERRLESMRSLWNGKLSDAQQIGWAAVVRRHLPEGDRLRAIAWPTMNWSDGDGRPMELAGISAYMERIEATREEREACLLIAAEERMGYASLPASTLRERVAAFRKWVGGHEPQLVEKATGVLLSGRNGISLEAADLALRYHAESGDDELLLPFLTYLDGTEEKAEIARRFAEQLTDGELRKVHLEKLEERKR